MPIEFTFPEPPDQAKERWIGEQADLMARTGSLSLVSQTSQDLIYEGQVRPTWTIVVAIFLFPIGLIALTKKETVTLRVHFEPAGESTNARVTGFADTKLIEGLISRGGTQTPKATVPSDAPVP